MSTDKALLDIDRMHAFLSTTYWSEQIPRALLEHAVENSLCFGVYRGRQQVGFARVITDYATFGYIVDVYVEPEFRGRGLSRRLMVAIMAHRDLQGMRRWHLVTRDAHGLYRQFGFSEIADPERHMGILDLDIYKRGSTQ